MGERIKLHLNAKPHTLSGYQLNEVIRTIPLTVESPCAQGQTLTLQTSETREEEFVTTKCRNAGHVKILTEMQTLALLVNIFSYISP